MRQGVEGRELGKAEGRRQSRGRRNCRGREAAGAARGSDLWYRRSKSKPADERWDARQTASSPRPSPPGEERDMARHRIPSAGRRRVRPGRSRRWNGLSGHSFGATAEEAGQLLAPAQCSAARVSLADSPKPVIEVGNCLGRVRINKKLQAKWQVVV